MMLTLSHNQLLNFTYLCKVILYFSRVFTHKTPVNTERIILGIDPGTQIMGYGIILQQGNAAKLLDLGVLNLNKILQHELKIKTIFDTILNIIDRYNPDCLAIESPFFGKNVQSMLKLGRAQGVAIAAALSREIPYCEYSPKRIKQSITGNGNASKEQVALMLQRLLGLKEIPKHLDATDGLAVAMCHFLQKDLADSPKNSTPPKTKKGSKSWANFLSNNSNRIIQ